MFTVKKALEKLAQFNGTAGTAWDAPSNLKRLNDVRELIYSRGDFEGTTTWCQVNLCEGCFYLPEIMETIRAVYICRGIADLKNAHYKEMGRLEAQDFCWRNHGFNAAVQATEIKKPYYVKPSGFFRAGLSGDSDADAGSVITINGRHSGMIVSSDVILKMDGISWTDKSFDEIDSVAKDVTAGPVTLYSMSGEQCEVILAEYSWWNEAPMFARYSAECHRAPPRSAILFGKKKFHAMRSGDVLDIQSMSALKFGYQALNIQSNESRDNEYVGKIQLMDESMNRSDRDLGMNESNEQPVARYDIHRAVGC